MGLCKCPKKKVTNQFCFEHRVNVCEHCLVSNHPRVSWLSKIHFESLLMSISFENEHYLKINELHQFNLIKESTFPKYFALFGWYQLGCIFHTFFLLYCPQLWLILNNIFVIQCIVKSYLHWLQDSDYNPVCTLCNGSLAEGDVIRLVCYGMCILQRSYPNLKAEKVSGWMLPIDWISCWHLLCYHILTQIWFL